MSVDKSKDELLACGHRERYEVALCFRCFNRLQQIEKAAVESAQHTLDLGLNTPISPYQVKQACELLKLAGKE